MNLRKIHILLGVQSLVIVLGSVNRLGSFTLAPVAGNEFLRWVDLVNLLPLPIASLIALYLLKSQIESGHGEERGGRRALGIAFTAGVYLLGAGYGLHEFANYLHIRFCTGVTGDLCRIVAFNDDEFSHWLFFGGFVLINGALLLLQAILPTLIPATRVDRALLAFNGVFIGAGVVANLAFEAIGVDMYVVVLLAVLSVALLKRKGPQPLLVYYSVAYVLGLAGTLAIRGLGAP
ncbi:MAG: hypothetical protein ACT4OM_00795 [Actinomycetota bacterium]